MRNCSIFLFLLVSCLVTTMVYADVLKPQWKEGYWWSIQTHLDVHIDVPDSSDSFDMVIDDNAPQYICQGTETRTLTKGSMNTYDVYKLTYEGTVTGEGTADISLSEIKIPIELRNGTISGESWVDTNTLGTVFNSRFITGELWAYYLFSWQQVGTAEIAISEEYEPVRDLNKFPIVVGNSWFEPMTQYTFGRYVVDYDLGSGQQHEEESFENTTTLQLTFNITNMEQYKTWSTYRSEGTAPDWSGILLSRYAPEAKNHAFVSMTQLEIPENGILIRELTSDLHGFNLTDPTPTPTPDPGQSGITLHLNKDTFEAGDPFKLRCTVVNSGMVIEVDQYVLLDILGLYYFWPSWSEIADFQTRTLVADSVYPEESIMEFDWPVVDSAASGLKFWGALLSSDSQQLHGDFDVVEWGYR